MYVPPLYHWPCKSRWLPSSLTRLRWESYAVYVHFPFCRSLCDFCGYYTTIGTRGAMRSYADALLSQLNIRREADEFLTKPEAVFFGGGTASLMEESLVGNLLDLLQCQSGEDARLEVTLECEPGTISKAKLRVLRALGVNRVSVAAQSFSDRTLTASGRRHTAMQAIRLVEACREVGIENIHVDLIYGLPGDDHRSLAQTLKTVTSLEVTHVSCYRLYIFKNSNFNQNQVAPRAERETLEYRAKLYDFYTQIQECLQGGDYRQYTLTEYCKTGFKSRYVTACFDGSNVLPLGASAFGRCSGLLMENARTAAAFGDSVRHVRALSMSKEEQFKRDVILGFWLLNVPLKRLELKHKVCTSESALKVFKGLHERGKLDLCKEDLRLDATQAYNVGAIMQELSLLPASFVATAFS